MAKSNKGGKTSTTAKKIQSQFSGRENPIKIGNNESRFQQTLERMQLTVVTGKFKETALTEQARKRLDKVIDMEFNLAKAGVKKAEIVSDYTELLNIFNASLKDVKLDDLNDAAKAEIARFIGKSRQPLNEKQTEIVEQFYYGKQRQAFSTITEIKNVLVRKGLISGNVTDLKGKKLEVNEKKAETATLEALTPAQ